MSALPMVVLCCRVALGAVFAVSVAGKVRDRAAFTEFGASLVRMRLAGPRTAAAVAGATVLAEAAVVVAMCLPGPSWPGSALALALLAVLTGGIVRTVRRGLAEPCRCFGAARRPLGRVHVVRNAVLGAVALAGGVAGLLDAGPPAPGALPPVVGVLVGVVAGLTLAAVLVRFEELVELFGPLPAPGRR
ncbi:MauE/DoxX family redox-associated membrane protein [Pseudonocardia humida]|uniref:Methylamine utilisation protein MauE domain-containing protein n=1 Tax=Pseudonocardia humida TaxID=2800819 RepID=A0ABT0ZSJ0_9PSEU|nr:MauE/DoxX family redox-associated membrane protein [Pseudonocardia humida]MCO1653683.1 hypothetical protein [Pseudonocardia humida]